MEKVLENQVSRFRNWEERARASESERERERASLEIESPVTGCKCFGRLFPPSSRLWRGSFLPDAPAPPTQPTDDSIAGLKPYTGAHTPPLIRWEARGEEEGRGEVVYTCLENVSRRWLLVARSSTNASLPPTTTPELSHSLPFLFHHDHLEAFRSTCQWAQLGRSLERTEESECSKITKFFARKSIR